MSSKAVLMQGTAMRAQRKASKQERLLVQSIAAAAATMEAPARPTSQEPGKAPGKPATQKPTVSSVRLSHHVALNLICCRKFGRAFQLLAACSSISMRSAALMLMDLISPLEAFPCSRCRPTHSLPADCCIHQEGSFAQGFLHAGLCLLGSLY